MAGHELVVLDRGRLEQGAEPLDQPDRVRLAAGRLAEAERAFAESIDRLPDNLVGYIYLIVAQVMAGKLAAARRTAETGISRSPDLSIGQARRWLLYRDPAMVEHRLDCLRRAGAYGPSGCAIRQRSARELRRELERVIQKERPPGR